MKRADPPVPGNKDWEDHLKRTAGKGSKKYRYPEHSRRLICPNCGRHGPFNVRKKDYTTAGPAAKLKCPKCGKVNRRKKCLKAYKDEWESIKDLDPPEPREKETCPHCEGSGVYQEQDEDPCALCRGQGTI